MAANQSKESSRDEKLKQPNKLEVIEGSLNYKDVISNYPVVSSVEAVHGLIRKLWKNEKIIKQERFVALFFNNDFLLTGSAEVFTKKTNTLEVDIKLLSCLALDFTSSYVVIAHNHPNGNIAPSKYDDLISLEIQQELQLIDVELLDYFVIVKDGFISLADAGWLF